MNTTHTPSPWIVSHDPDGTSDDYCIGVPDGKVDQIAVCSKRDAALIAAAPDMYEALECLTLVVGLTAFKHDEMAWRKIIARLGQRAPLQEAMDQACAALAKARGQ